MAPDAAAQHEIDRLTAEVERLRALERGLLAERERIRAESAAEIARLQDALRAAAGHARAADSEPREREALAALRLRLEVEHRRLDDERRRLEEESDRLAEWERRALSGGPSTPLPMTFREGLARLAEPGVARGASPEGSW